MTSVKGRWLPTWALGASWKRQFTDRFNEVLHLRLIKERENIVCQGSENNLRGDKKGELPSEIVEDENMPKIQHCTENQRIIWHLPRSQ